jgi:hypothetical protein
VLARRQAQTWKNSGFFTEIVEVRGEGGPAAAALASPGVRPNPSGQLEHAA